MSRAAQTFKQGNFTKALKGAEKAGLKVQRAVIDNNGRFVLDFNQPPQSDIATDVNEWDSVK